MKHRDLNIFFAKNDETGDISYVSNTSSIIQSIKNIVLTKKGERPFKDYFGTNLLDLFFDIPSPAQLAFIQKDIKDALNELEPRILVENISIIYPETASSGFDITINIDFYLSPSQGNASNKQTIVLTVGSQ